jgi:hypothetical protein
MIDYHGFSKTTLNWNSFGMEDAWELTVVKLYGGASVKGTLEWKKGISCWLWYLPAYEQAKQHARIN